MSLTVPEVARRLGKNPETVRRWIREGKLPAAKIGSQHFIEEEDVEVYEADDDLIPSKFDELGTFWGGPMPNFLRALRESRVGH